MGRLQRISRETTEHVLSEGTRAFIDKLAAELVAEDMKRPEVRAWVRQVVERDYGIAWRKMRGTPARRRTRRAAR